MNSKDAEGSNLRVGTDEPDNLSRAAAVLKTADNVSPADLVPRLIEAYPWVAKLNESERVAFATEFLEAGRASLTQHSHSQLVATIRGWRATANAYAAGIRPQTVEWLDHPIPVDDPRTSRRSKRHS